MNDEIAIGYWYCISSQRRYDIVMTLGSEGYLTPTNIAKKSNIRVNHISNLLRELKDYNIIVCVNEGVRKGKLYRLTNFGEELLPYLKGEKKLTG